MIASLAGISLPSEEEEILLRLCQMLDFVKQLNSFDDISENNSCWLHLPKSYLMKLLEGIKPKRPPEGKLLLILKYEKFIEQVDVSMDKKSGYLKISFEHFSPNFSYNFVNLIINELNIVTREKDISESQAALDYLLNQLSSTEVANVRNSISLLINNQLEKLMLANVKEDYLISTIDEFCA